MIADQNGTRSASVGAIVVCIPVLLLAAAQAVTEQFSSKKARPTTELTVMLALQADRLKNRNVDFICDTLAEHLANSPSTNPSTSQVSYRSAKSDQWWPDDLGAAGSVGAQNDMAYAVFPSTRRLAIRDGGKVMVYDTGAHDIRGVAQAQSTDQTLTFTSQNGLVRVSDLDEMASGKGRGDL